MTMPVVLPDDDGIRPAGSPTHCFYCDAAVGEPHEHTCVILLQRMWVEYTFSVEIEVPWSWDADKVEWHRNNGGWCADNALREVAQADDGCCCGRFECRVVSGDSPHEPPFRKNNRDEVVP